MLVLLPLFLSACAETKSAAEGGVESAADAGADPATDAHDHGGGGLRPGNESSPTAPAPSGGAPTGGGTQSTANLAGTFTLQLVAPTAATDSTPARPAQSSFIGSVTDGPIPVANTWVKAQEADGCTLYTPEPRFCDPACGVSAVCVNDDECVPHPAARSVGTIHLSGTGERAVSMTPIANKYQPQAGTALPFPPCTEGADVQLRVEGGNYQPFELSASCIGELEFDGPVKITRGEPLKLTWSAPGKAAVARIEVHVDISHHGGTRGKIDCHLEDTGSFAIPAAMVDKLVDLGVSGFPTVVVARVASGGVKSGEPARVKLVVQQSIEREIQIDGLVSCTEDGDCPAPKTCQTDLSCK